MRRLFQVILIILTISFSAFLIERSCHEDSGDYAPDRSGGISQAIRPTVETPTAAASPASPAPPAGEEYPSEDMAATRVSRAKPRNESTANPAPSKEAREVSARVTSTATPRTETASTATPPTETASTATPRTETASPEVATPSAATASTTTSAANTGAAANEKLQGTWVLSDGKTRFELTVVNDSGVLKAHFVEAGKSVTVEEKVQVTAQNDSIYVYTSRLRLSAFGIMPGDRRDEPIVLAFNFNADGSPQVVWHQARTNRSTRLNVVSRVR